MNQDVIWDHFQNEGVASFDEAAPRLEFLVRQLRRGERALNVGVGSGYLEKHAGTKGIEMWSLDPSDRAIDRIRATLGLGERAQAGRSEAMPFPTGHFDAVIMSEVLEHLSDDVRGATLDEVHRVLKPGGRFIGTVPARERLQAAEVVCPECHHHFHRWGHQASFDIDSMRRFLETRLVVTNIHERFFAEWESASWKRRLAGLLKRFLSWRGLGPYGVARNIYFSAEKK